MSKFDGLIHLKKSRSEIPPEWCLVGNVYELGTSKFSAGTKLFCLPPIWGDGYERCISIGRSRSGRYIEIVMPTKRIVDYRAVRVYSPKILRRLSAFNIRWESKENVLATVAILGERFAGDVEETS